MEYNFDRLEQLVDVLGDTLGGNLPLSRAIDHPGDALEQRRGETARGMLYLRRARQLDIEQDRFEIIRRLGTVVECLTKEEYLSELVEAAYLLTVAYRGAGLCRQRARTSPTVPKTITYLADSCHEGCASNGRQREDFGLSQR